MRLNGEPARVGSPTRVVVRHPSAPAFGLLATLLVATLCTPSAAFAQKTDVVTLKRGDVLTGEVKQLSRGKLTYKTDDLGTVYIEWEKIAHVESEHFFEVEVESGAKYFGRLGRTDVSEELAVILADTVVLRLHEVVFIVPIRDSFWTRVDGYVNLGIDFTKANNLRTLNLDGQTSYRGPRWSVRVNGSSYLQAQDSVETTSRNQLGVQITRLLSGKWNLLGVTSLEENSQLGLDLRTTVGAGATYDLFTTNLHALYFGASVSYARERYASVGPGLSEGQNTGQFSLDADYNLFRFVFPKVDVYSDLAIVPVFTDWGRIRIDFNSSISYEIFKDFTLNLQFYDNFDSRSPSTGLSQNDYGLTFGFGYKF
ncbi:MAG: DUF481 domain-containing protein [Candidatus Palauibacterales bacterium]|nr:DUF481 domain-containing protein [Candidatus Palauibacterales bacterium]MDP2483835.1 DUF481 domain-containing protein [Candidatus Palauibacterales bacterium]